MGKKTWTTTKVRGRIYEVCVADDGEVVILGVLDPDEDENTGHNCDANGCGQDHVLWRGPRKATP